MLCFVGTLAGVLLPELLTCLIIIAKKTPELLHLLNVVTVLDSLLDALDEFNRCAPGLLRDDTDDLSFPSLQGLSTLLADDLSFPSLQGLSTLLFTGGSVL